MTTRSVTGQLLDQHGVAMAGETVKFLLDQSSYTAGATYVPEIVTVTTDVNGQFATTLWCNGEGSVATRYTCSLPDGESFQFILPAGGSSISIQALRAASETSYSGWSTTVQTLIDTHADIIASETILGHVRIGDGLSIDEDGVLAAEGGGAVDSVNGQAGVVVLDAGDVGADPAGTASGLVATEATTRAAADTTETNARIAADAAHVAAADPHTQYHTDARGDARYGRLAAANAWTQNQSFAGRFDITPITAPSNPAAGHTYLFVEDLGSGILRLAARFPTGAVQEIIRELVTGGHIRDFRDASGAVVAYIDAYGNIGIGPTALTEDDTFGDPARMGMAIRHRHTLPVQTGLVGYQEYSGQAIRETFAFTSKPSGEYIYATGAQISVYVEPGSIAPEQVDAYNLYASNASENAPDLLTGQTIFVSHSGNDTLAEVYGVTVRVYIEADAAKPLLHTNTAAAVWIKGPPVSAAVIGTLYGIKIDKQNEASATIAYAIHSSGGQVFLRAGGGTTKVLIVRGEADQSVNLQEWQNNLGVSLAAIDKDGNLSQPAKTANTMFAGPASGAAAAPTWRALVAADLPAGTATTANIATHEADTTAVHGIADTSALVLTNDSRLSDTRTPTDGSVSTAKVANDAITYAKMQNVSATDKVLGRSSSGAGDVEEIALTAAGRALIDDASAAAQRVTIGVDGRTAVNNADYTILTTDKYVAQTGTLSAARTFTLPAANAVNAGYEIIIADESGTPTDTNKISIARAGSDTINGATASVVIKLPNEAIRFISNGVSSWTVSGLLRIPNVTFMLMQNNNVPTAGTNEMQQYASMETPYMYMDLSNAVQIRAACYLVGVSGSDPTLEGRLQYYNGSSWVYFDGSSGPKVAMGSTGGRAGAWVTIPAAARTEVLVRAVYVSAGGFQLRVPWFGLHLR